MSDEGPTADEVAEFVIAVRRDEYAELPLETGDTLVTDWEGDGTFWPYVVLTGDHGDKHPSDILADVDTAIYHALGVYASGAEMTDDGLLSYTGMRRPDRPKPPHRSLRA